MSPSGQIPELSLDEAWSLLSSSEHAVLIDVRTRAEWTFVGVPNLDDLGKEVMLVEWNQFPNGQPNPEFLAQTTQNLSPDQDLLLLCRSGGRSLAAAKALQGAGFTKSYNVSAGFEGDLDQDEHRQGGWKQHLPWRQS